MTHIRTISQTLVLALIAIIVTPIGDSAGADNSDLPRYLFIGDSISRSYERGLRAALEGKFDVHHPPTNCGSSARGRANIMSWLGAYGEKGRQWDVISFNHGHWDSDITKSEYQENLEAIIVELKKTGAKLIWVTTCPVPHGQGEAKELTEEGRAPGSKAGVMEKFFNLWAAEVMSRHPEISICDQWHFVKNNEGGLYTQWWAGRDVHFNGEPADALGRLLADHALRVAGDLKTRAEVQPQAKR